VQNAAYDVIEKHIVLATNTFLPMASLFMMSSAWNQKF